MKRDPLPLAPPLKAISQFTDRVPGWLAIGICLVLLLLAVLLDWRPIGIRIAFPLYYLIPICLLAWFVGWLPGLAATMASAALSFGGLVLTHSPADYPGGFLLGRILTFAGVLLAARITATARLMLEFFALGDQLRARIVPIRVGPRLVSIPTRDPDIRDHDFKLKPGDIPLLIRPGMAFGSGSHPTTQMCLLLLEEYLHPGQLVFDFGSGSGILSIAAVKLGARKAFAVDVAPVAERMIQENIKLNGLEGAIRFRLGSWPLFLETSPDDGWLTEGESSADLLLGNLLASILVEALQEGLRRCVIPGGKLILSGILADHRDRVREALEESGLDIIEWRRIEEWLAVVASVPADPPKSLTL